MGREEVRYFYWHAEPPKPELVHFKGAWHVRHGDILDNCKSGCEWRLLNDNQLKHGVSVLKQKFGSKLQKILLFTGGQPEEFKEVLLFCSKLGLGCELHTG